MAHYLYGLVPADAAAPSRPGVDGGEVTVHPLDAGLAVLRSEVDGHAIQPRRAHLAAHDGVLAAAMGDAPVLPLRFGMITDQDPTVIMEGLDVADVQRRMSDLDGRVEVQLLWDADGDVSLRRVADQHPEVRDRTIAQVDRGRMIADAVATLAVEDLVSITDEVTHDAAAVGPVRGRGGSVRVAVLVEADLLETFLDRCDQVAQRVSSAGRLRTVGALPPYSFAAPDDTVEV